MKRIISTLACALAVMIGTCTPALAQLKGGLLKRGVTSTFRVEDQSTLSGALQATVVPASRTPGALLWQDQFDLAGGFDGATMVAVEGGRVFVSGLGTSVAGAPTDWLVRAYDAQAGVLLWQNQLDRTGREDYALAVAVKGGLVFAGGSATNAAGSHDVLVRAYDALTGDLRWEDQFDRAGRFDVVTSQTIAVEGGRLFVGGEASQANGNADWFVRAYDAQTGAFLWQDFFDGGSFDHAVSLAAHGQLLVASGLTTDAAILRHFTVRAYDAGSGALRWQDQVPIGNAGFFAATDVGWHVEVQGDRVVVGGSIGDGTDAIRLAVRAYDAQTGALLWHDLVDKGGGFDNAFGVALDGGRAFVAGLGGAGVQGLHGQRLRLAHPRLRSGERCTPLAEAG